jgi:hypothetical protein
MSIKIPKPKEAEKLSTRFGRILDKSFNEIYIFDAKTLKFVQVNAGARKNIGYSYGRVARYDSSGRQTQN